jgi:hypothetical protein
MQDEPRELLHSPEFGWLAKTLSGMGVPVEVDSVQAGSVAERPAPVLRVGHIGGPVISEISLGVNFERIWGDTDIDIHRIASASSPVLLVASVKDSGTNVRWALDIASELAVLMLSTHPPDGTVLHIAVPEMLTGRAPHVASTEARARAFFLAGKVTLSPFRWGDSTLKFGVEQEQWAIAAVRTLSPRLGGASGFCGCCSSNDAAAYVYNYSERG